MSKWGIDGKDVNEEINLLYIKLNSVIEGMFYGALLD